MPLIPAERNTRTSRTEAPAPVHEPGALPVSIVFFVSGAAGLIFEIVWLHRCGLLFGNSVWATSLILSSFMAGLIS